MTATQPIGLFDSGVGGLTVANAILDSLPNEQIVYFGDSLHFPYGEKTPEAIREYAHRITEFLLEKNCKAIIIACNTASALAFDVVKTLVSNHALALNVIDPTTFFVSKYLPHHSHIGVIGTRATIKSQAYEKALLERIPNLNVSSLATPLLAPMIEEGFVHGEVSKQVTEHYLRNPILQGIDSIILACTHYPLIKKDVQEFYKYNVDVIDTPTVVAEYLKMELNEKNLLNTTEQVPTTHTIYVSTMSDTIVSTTQQFFSHPFELIEKNIF